MPRVNPEILSWARKTAGFSQSDAVEKLGINDARGVAAVDRLAAIESGAEEPSRSPASTNLKGISDSLSSPTTGEGGNHGCEGDFGKEVCCEAERRGTRTA